MSVLERLSNKVHDFVFTEVRRPSLNLCYGNFEFVFLNLLDGLFKQGSSLFAINVRSTQNAPDQIFSNGVLNELGDTTFLHTLPPYVSSQGAVGLF